jgi:Trk-type K+ transport system membrane component
MLIQMQVIGRDLSRFLLIPTGMALCSLPVAMIAQDWFTVVPFLVTLLGSGGLSLLLRRLSRNAPESSLSQIFICVALGWGVISADWPALPGQGRLGYPMIASPFLDPLPSDEQTGGRCS